MAQQIVALHVNVSGKTYPDAARQIQFGSQSGNPVALALIEHDVYIPLGYTGKCITLMDILIGRRHSGSMPPVLTDYLAGFRSGRLVFGDHEFERVLESEGG